MRAIHALHASASCLDLVLLDIHVLSLPTTSTCNSNMEFESISLGAFDSSTVDVIVGRPYIFKMSCVKEKQVEGKKILFTATSCSATPLCCAKFLQRFGTSALWNPTLCKVLPRGSGRISSGCIITRKRSSRTMSLPTNDLRQAISSIIMRRLLCGATSSSSQTCGR
jgi:hypothetical protein